MGSEAGGSVGAPYRGPTELDGAVFVGHLVTDCDSVAGAIGGAELYAGVPARASELNPETEYALERWGFDPPAPVEDLLAGRPEAAVCLVDHQQRGQIHPAVLADPARIAGVIDHHALQSGTVITNKVAHGVARCVVKAWRHARPLPAQFVQDITRCIASFNAIVNP